MVVKADLPRVQSPAVPRLKNIDKASHASGEIKEDVVDPIKWSASLSGHSVEGLGVAGGALGSVNGFNMMLNGVRARSPRQVLAGAAETTAAAASLAVLGIIGGATWLAPVGAGLLLTRALGRAGSPERATRIDGTIDTFSALVLMSSAAHFSHPTVLCLGAGAALVNGLRGLHRINVGHRAQEDRLKIRGTGEIISSIGLATLLAGAPGTALVFGGASLSLLQRIPALRPHMDNVVKAADRTLYPLSVHTDAALNHIQARLQPLQKPAEKIAGQIGSAVGPVVNPVRRVAGRIGNSLLAGAAGVLDRLSSSAAFHKVDDGIGALREMLLPEPGDKVKPVADPTPVAENAPQPAVDVKPAADSVPAA